MDRPDQASAALPNREDIKAALRKKHGTLLAFERAAGLPKNSTKDVLRGRPVGQTERAIAAELKKELHQLFPRRYRRDSAAKSTKVDNTSSGRAAQCLNSRAV